MCKLLHVNSSPYVCTHCLCSMFIRIYLFVCKSLNSSCLLPLRMHVPSVYVLYVCMFPLFLFLCLIVSSFVYPLHVFFPPCVRPSFCMSPPYVCPSVYMSRPCVVSLFDCSFICISPPYIYLSTCTLCISLQVCVTFVCFSLRVYTPFVCIRSVYMCPPCICSFV